MNASIHPAQFISKASLMRSDHIHDACSCVRFGKAPERPAYEEERIKTPLQYIVRLHMMVKDGNPVMLHLKYLQSMRSLRPPWTTLPWSPSLDMTHFASLSLDDIEANAKESVLWAK